MSYLIIKAALSGIIVLAASEFARRSPGLGGLIASLPLVSILAMIWLWQDTADRSVSRLNRGDLLVRAAVAADVPGTAGNAAAGTGILAGARAFVPADPGALFADDLGPVPPWRSLLGAGGTPHCHANHAYDFNVFVSCHRPEGRYVAPHSGSSPLPGGDMSPVPRQWAVVPIRGAEAS
jgi:hypothetical protein